MARREVDEERKSYSAVFLVAVGLLLFGSVWSIWDDNVVRRPWKKYQTTFYELERRKAEDVLAAEDRRLGEDPAVREVERDLAAARQEVESGATAAALAELEADLEAAQTRESDWDLKIRIVKSEIEAAKYEYEHAVELAGGKGGEKEHEYLKEKEAEKADLDSKYKAAMDARAAIEAKIDEKKGRVKELEAKLRELTTEREQLASKLDGMTLNVPIGVGTLRFPRVPKIQQIVLNEFDRNAYDQPVGRVDRCISCHAGIDKPGFEDQPNPFRTHPDRKTFLGAHPVEKFACTPCHEGQAPAVNSVAMAHGEVEFWEHPLLRGNKVQSSCIACHNEVHRLPYANQIAAGEKYFEQLGCHGCHLVEGYDGLAKVGPSLRNVAAKGNPAWMVSWIENPHRFRARSKMPWFLLSREQSEQAAAFVLAASREESEKWLAEHPEPRRVDPANAELVEKGKQLTESVGCRGCHAFAPEEVASALGETKDVAPNLSRVGEKTTARWIYGWIQNPRGYNPATRMPSLRLSDDEAAAITSYLLTLRTEAPAPAEESRALEDRLTKAETVAAGQKLVRKYGCFGCHDIPGMEKESRIGVELTYFGSKNLEELFFGSQSETEIPRTWDDWTFHKLEDPRIYQTEFIEQVMPNFHLSPQEIRSLRVFLASRVEHKVPPQYRFPDPGGRMAKLVEGRRLVEKYNCVGCHVIDTRGGNIRARYEENPTFAPPILNGEGSKVQGNWLFSFVKSPTPIRPWLAIRMPTFGLSDEEARTVVEYFQALDDVKTPFVYFDEAKVPVERLEAAKVLTSNDYFACFTCHQRGDQKPEGPPEGWAPDLGMAHERLNPDWIVRWIHDPQKLMEGTKMPSFYPGGPEDVLGGDEVQQIEALRDYLMLLEKADNLIGSRPKPSAGATAPPGQG